MHLADGLLSTPVWASLAAGSGVCVAYALHRTQSDLDERRVPLLGVTAAFVFAAQMVNVPIGSGVSIHFVGSALAAIVLGPWAGMVVMAAVLLIQCFVFQDGGLTALGANFANMGALGVGAASAVYCIATGMFGPRRGLLVGAFTAAWLASVLPACACALELGASGTLPTGPTLAALGGVHALAGIFEGLVTVSALGLLRQVRPELLAVAPATGVEGRR